MNKKLFKNLAAFSMLALFFVVTTPVLAAVNLGLTDEVNSAIGLGSEDPRVIIARIINTAMMFLGIIAVVIVLLGGFKWMTAAGSEDKISEAKKLMGAGVVGLVIILASWGIATFILNQLQTATNA